MSATFAAQVTSRPPSAEESAQFSGWYEFTHPGGSFEICLRPGGVLYAPGFVVGGSRWCLPDPSKVALTVRAAGLGHP